MTIEKGLAWGVPAPIPFDGVVVGSDAEARAVVEGARRSGRPVPVLGLLGGDLCRTVGGGGDRRRIGSPEAVMFSVDIGCVVADGGRHWFVAHLVARRPMWRRAFVAMNAQWYGDWDLAPRSHPNDGLLDTYDAGIPLRDLPKVRARLPHGAHLPHPGIRERRAAEAAMSWRRPRMLELDGVRLGRVRTLSVSVEPDALRVVV